MKLITSTTLFSMLILNQAAIAQTPVSTAFTYQGHLKQSGSPVNTDVNMAFSLWDAVTLGTQQGLTLTFDGAGGNPPPVNVSNGLISIQLDFGVNPYTENQGRWLEITINGQPLSPRQPLSPTPFALNTRGVNVNATGNIGIGTASPAVKLHLSDSTQAPESRTNGDGLMVDNDVWGANSVYQSGSTFLGRTYWNGDNVGRPDWTLDTRNVSSALVVDGNSGNVGIGTATPGNKLEITAGSNGDGIRVTGATAPLRSPGYHLYDNTIQRGTLGLAEGASIFSTDAVVGDIVLRANTGKLLLQNGTGASALALSGNRVGIGTTSPENTLHVFMGSAGSITGNASAPLIVENSANTYINVLAPDANEQGILFGKPIGGSAAGGIIYDSSSTTDGLQFRVNGNSTMMVLDSAGNVGISTGAITPGAKLDVRGDIKLGPLGEFQAPAAEERLRILRGHVSSTGGPTGAVGWTSIRTSLGAYTVTFTTNFSGAPTVTASALDSNVLQSAVIAGFTVGSAQFKTYNSAGALVDTDFMFIAIGAR